MDKFCKNCGKETQDGNKFCMYCGTKVEEESIASTENKIVTTEAARINAFALVGFILAMSSLVLNFWGTVGIAATVFSGIGLSKTGPGKDRGRGFAIAGLIVGIGSIIYGFLTICFFVLSAL